MPARGEWLTSQRANETCTEAVVLKDGEFQMGERHPIHGANFPQKFSTDSEIHDPCQQLPNGSFSGLPASTSNQNQVPHSTPCLCVPRYVHVLSSFTYVSDCTLLKGKGQPYHLAHCDSRHNRPCKYGTHTEPVNAPNKSMEIKALSHPLGWRQSLFSEVHIDI